MMDANLSNDTPSKEGFRTQTLRFWSSEGEKYFRAPLTVKDTVKVYEYPDSYHIIDEIQGRAVAIDKTAPVEHYYELIKDWQFK